MGDLPNTNDGELIGLKVLPFVFIWKIKAHFISFIKIIISNKSRINFFSENKNMTWSQLMSGLLIWIIFNFFLILNHCFFARKGKNRRRMLWKWFILFGSKSTKLSSDSTIVMIYFSGYANDNQICLVRW